MNINCLNFVDSFLMFGIPAVSEHLLNVEPVEDIFSQWILENMKWIYLYSLPYAYPIGLSAQTASVYLTVVLTIEREVTNGPFNLTFSHQIT